jgi:Low-density lipoprotein receptor repeat class B
MFIQKLVFNGKMNCLHLYGCFACSYLFWVDADNQTAKIERSDLSGNNRTVLVTQSAGKLVYPTRVVVDVILRRLYWLDPAAGQVGSCNFDGSELESFSNPKFSLMSSLALYQVTHVAI